MAENMLFPELEGEKEVFAIEKEQCVLRQLECYHERHRGLSAEPLDEAMP